MTLGGFTLMSFSKLFSKLFYTETYFYFYIVAYLKSGNSGIFFSR